MKKIKSAFLILSVLTFMFQPVAFGECDKVKKACSISDLNKISANTELKKTQTKDQSPQKQNVKESIKSWLKSLK